MTTPTVNLLPAARLRRIRAFAVARWWVLGGVIYTAALLAGAGVYSMGVVSDGGDSSLATVAAARLVAARAEREALSTQVTDLRKRVDAARAVGHHPDWSVLLRHLAVSRPSSVVLERCELRRIETTENGPAGSSPRKRVTLEFTITGTATALADVHAFVGVVEDSAVFESVRLGETSAEAAAQGSHVTRFSIRCTADEPEQEGQP